MAVYSRPTKMITWLILTTSLFSSFFSYASQCNINFNYGVVIDPIHIRFLENDKTYVQINNQDQLFVSGKEISLSIHQKSLLKEYTSGIREQVPQMVSIAIESVDVGLKAISKVIAGLTGENSASHQKLQKRFDELQWRLRQRFNQSAKNFYIAPQDFDDFDEIFGGQFEQEIESIITGSIGTILAAVGEAVTNTDEENTESRVVPFDNKMTTIGDELAQDMNEKVSYIESKKTQSL